MRAGPIAGNQVLLKQGVALLTRIPPETFVATPGRSSVGAQYRHILDHYFCLLDGLASGDIDYDARRRDPQIEAEPATAATRTEELMARLTDLLDTDLTRPLQVHLTPTADAEDCTRYGSTVGRELLFLVSHTVHHFAIIRLLLEDTGIPCDPEFGMAPSTLCYYSTAG